MGASNDEDPPAAQLGRFPAVHITNPDALAAANKIPDRNPPTVVAAPDLLSMTVRDLLYELAATEHVLRQRPDDSVHRSTGRR